MILQVKKFNQEAKARYNKAMDKWRLVSNPFSPKPFLPMYLFLLKDNYTERVKGWVVVKPNNYRFFKNRQLALKTGLT